MSILNDRWLNSILIETVNYKKNILNGKPVNSSKPFFAFALIKGENKFNFSKYLCNL